MATSITSKIFKVHTNPGAICSRATLKYSVERQFWSLISWCILIFTHSCTRSEMKELWYQGSFVLTVSSCSASWECTCVLYINNNFVNNLIN